MERSRARNVLLVSVAITLVLYLVPYGQYVGYPLLLVSTLVHELGHGVTAMLLGGDFDRFLMHADGSGVAYWSGDLGRLGRALVAAGGLVGPPVAAAVCFVAARRARGARIALAVLGALLVLAALLVVRNAFGLVFVAALAAVCLGLALRAGDEVARLGLVFLAVQLALSSYSRGDYLFTRWADGAGGRMPSDVEHMARALLLPFWFWGAVCAAFSLAVIAAGGWLFLRRGADLGQHAPRAASRG